MTVALHQIDEPLRRPASGGLLPVTAIVEHNCSKLRRALSKQIDPPAYPVEALGPIAEVCADVARDAQVAPALVAHSFLGAAALLCQGEADVRTMVGVRPLSLYLLAVAGSGEAKSVAEEVALRRIRQHQKERARSHQFQLAEYEKAKPSRGEVPVRPRAPFLLVKDATMEGLRTGFEQGRPSQGVFTAEASMMLGGYGMTPENRMKTAGCLNSLWDDGDLSVSRQLAGRIELPGRRLTMGLMIQPDAVRASFADPLLSNIGLFPRFLLCWPPMSLPRTARPFRAEEISSVRTYWNRCSELLARKINEDCGSLPVIETTAGAQGLLAEFFERMEKAAKVPGGPYDHVRAFAVRATEQVHRVAGVLTAWEGLQQVDADRARNAMAIVLHSLETWAQVFGDREEVDAHKRAADLYGWLLRQPGRSVKYVGLLRIGPKQLRSRDLRDEAVAILEHVGAVSIDAGTVTAELMP